MESTLVAALPKSNGTVLNASVHECAAIESRLRSTGHHPLRHVRCEAVDGIIELSGVVPTYFLKQLAQTVALDVIHEAVVRNRLEVRSQRSLPAR